MAFNRRRLWWRTAVTAIPTQQNFDRVRDREEHRVWLAMGTWLALAMAALVTFWPVVHHDFLTLDDPDYITLNPHVQGGLTWSGLGWALTTFHAGNWHPLTWLSHQLDVTLFGKGAAGPHFINLVLHVGNVLLLFGLLKLLTGARWRAALVAGLFALHPLRVESVAWLSERKDLLCALFALLTLLCLRTGPRGFESPIKPDKSLVLGHIGLLCFGVAEQADGGNSPLRNAFVGLLATEAAQRSCTLSRMACVTGLASGKVTFLGTRGGILCRYFPGAATRGGGSVPGPLPCANAS